MCCRTLLSGGRWICARDWLHGSIQKYKVYHLDDFRGVDMDTLSWQEKFNLTHLSLRNVVERTFGVLKARWHISHGVPFCHREKQKMIIMSCFAMHIFLRNREIGVGSPTYPPSDWVQINANSTMSLVREYISVALWGQ